MMGLRSVKRWSWELDIPAHLKSHRHNGADKRLFFTEVDGGAITPTEEFGVEAEVARDNIESR